MDLELRACRFIGHIGYNYIYNTGIVFAVANQAADALT